MKFGITGHTEGLGPAIIAEIERLHRNMGIEPPEYVGFSRTTGYDISDLNVIPLIVHDASDCDLFINNAYDPIGQVALFEKLIEAWKDLPKVIVNISSRYTHENNTYCDAKRTLDQASRNAVRLKHKCEVINLKPGLFDTERVRHIPGERMTPTDAAYGVYLSLMHSRLYYPEYTIFRIHEMTYGL